MATSTPAEQIVTITVPAECADDFRYAVVRDIKYDTGWFGDQHAELLAAAERPQRPETLDVRVQDRAGAMNALRKSARLLDQLPDEDTELTVSGTASQFVTVLEEMGRYLVKRVAEQYEYSPPVVEEVLPLLERLRWSAEQAVAFEAVA